MIGKALVLLNSGCLQTSWAKCGASRTQQAFTAAHFSAVEGLFEAVKRLLQVFYMGTEKRYCGGGGFMASGIGLGLSKSFRFRFSMLAVGFPNAKAAPQPSCSDFRG